MHRYLEPQPFDHYTLLSVHKDKWYVEEQRHTTRIVLGVWASEQEARNELHHYASMEAYRYYSATDIFWHFRVPADPESDRKIIDQIPNKRRLNPPRPVNNDH